MPDPNYARPDLAVRMREHVERLCAAGDRDLGTQRNREATRYVTSVMRDAGLHVDELPFEVPEWRAGAASLHADGHDYALHAGPYSPSADAEGPLIVVTSAGQLDGLDASGSVLLLTGEIASIQLTPRDYPFYQNAEHAVTLDALEASGALAVIAATGKNPSMTAAMSPFPLIEEPRFTLPTAYLRAEDGAALAAVAQGRVHVLIDSAVVPSTGIQPVGLLSGTGAGRVVIGGHIDSKPGTPGALDNACGVAVLLGAAELLATSAPGCSVEFVPFNGEDHVLAPGELAYLSAHPATGTDLMINIDAAGLPGSPSACSHYNLDAPLLGELERLLANSTHVASGEPWYASDHAIFAMQGLAAVAITSTDFGAIMDTYAHTPLDTPEVPDYELLAETARFVAEMVRVASDHLGKRE